MKDDFLAKLPLAKWEDENLIRFEREMYLTYDRIVFVRDCYRSLFPIVFDRVRKRGKCLITGTPGTGKTFFGFFAIRKLLDSGFTVIHIDMGWDWTNLYIPDVPSVRVMEILAEHDEPQAKGPWMGRFSGTSQGLAPDARKLYGALTSLVGDVVVVLDPPNNFGSGVFIHPECGMLVVTGPSTQRTASVTSSGGVDTFYMPIWSEQELRTLLEKRKGAPLLDEENHELGLRVLRFGGIPRFVARSDCDHSEMVSLSEHAINELLIRLECPISMVDVLNPFHLNPFCSGRIVHLLTTAKFDLAGKRFATEIIERQILARYWRRSQQALQTLMSSTSNICGFSSTTGRLNELWWHVALQEGGQIKRIQLKAKPSRDASCLEYVKGPLRNAIIPSTASRYSAKQNLADVKSLWDLEEDEQGIYVHFLKGNVPLVNSISILDGQTGKKVFGFESPIPDPPPNASAESTISPAAEGGRRRFSAPSHVPASSTSATSMISGTNATPPCVLLNQVTTNSENSFSWASFVELVELVRKLCPSGTSLHFCWVTSETIAKDFRFVFPPGADPSLMKLIPQWLLIVPDEALPSSFTTSDFFCSRLGMLM